MKSARVSCVIFDVDGTLSRTNDLIFSSFNHVIGKYVGKTMTPAEIISLFGPPEEGGLLRVIEEEDLPAAMDELCDYYRAHHQSMSGLHKGMDNILSMLKGRGIRLAVFTGKGRRTATITLEELNIAPFFEIVVSGNDVVHHKPHPEGITKILDTFMVDPEEVLMVGDSLSDIKASRGAGVRFAAVLWDSYDPVGVEAAGPDYVFRSVDALHSWLSVHAQ
jgi:pyrophosphatase PpaX